MADNAFTCVIINKGIPRYRYRVKYISIYNQCVQWMTSCIYSLSSNTLLISFYFVKWIKVNRFHKQSLRSSFYFWIHLCSEGHIVKSTTTVNSIARVLTLWFTEAADRYHVHYLAVYSMRTCTVTKEFKTFIYTCKWGCLLWSSIALFLYLRYLIFYIIIYNSAIKVCKFLIRYFTMVYWNLIKSNGHAWQGAAEPGEHNVEESNYIKEYLLGFFLLPSLAQI